MTNQRRVLGILTNGGLVTEANVHNIVNYRTHDRVHEKESDLNLELDNNNLEKYYKTEYVNMSKYPVIIQFLYLNPLNNYE